MWPVRFYDVLTPHARGRLARCDYSAMAGNRFVLLLEDLAPAEQGDQIAGCGVEDLDLALANLAELQASLWEHPALAEYAPETGPNPQGDEMFAGFLRWGTDEFVRRYADRLAPDDVDVLHVFAERARGFRTNRRAPRTVFHGDYRLDNLLFRDSPRECTIVDWQTGGAGPAGHDLAYCIATSLDPATRRAAERDLVAQHGARLRAQGVERSGEELWDDYRFGLGQGITVTVLGAVVATRTPRGDEMFTTVIGRVCAAVRDNDTLSMYA
jgi:hypothetical protein